MTYDDFTTLLAGTNLSGQEFARMLSLNTNTVSGYKRTGQVPNHLAVIATLIRKLEESGIDYRSEIEALDLQPNARRGRAFSGDTD